MAKKSLLRLNTGELAKIKVLAASGMSHRAIAKKLGRDHKTIGRACASPEMADKIEVAKDKIAILYEDLTERFLVSISAKDIEKINALQRVTAAAIATDKNRLLKGESTQNVALHSIVEAIERKRRRKRLPRAAQGEVQRITAEAERMKGGE